MKHLFLKITMLLLVLGMSVNVAWADDAPIYLASLKAQTDLASSTGSGQVKLTWLDITGRPMAVDLAKQINYIAFSDPLFMGKDYAYDGFGDEAQLVGGTLVALEGMEVPIEIGGTGSQIYQTSFLYFHAEAEPAEGSYLAEWRIVGDDNLYVTRMTSSMSPADPMGKIVYTQEWSDEEQAWIDVIDYENSILPLRTPCFKVLPDKANSTAYPGPGIMTLAPAVAASPNHLYAVFNKYLLANPVATSANLEAVEDAEAHLTVTVEVNGEAASLDEADFAAFTFTNNGSNEWSYDLAAALASKEVVSDQKTRIVIPVTYTYEETGAGAKNTTMTISMAGDEPSVLNVNLSVEALDPNRPEAFWLDGKVEKTNGDLSDLLNVDISAYANPILKLNKPVATALTFSGKNFTLDLNGNTAQAITVSDGNVTIAYSSFGGSAASLIVNGGKTTLVGGTFGSLTIGPNGTVEQNGATITGAATNNGTLTTTAGTINGGLTSSKTLTLNGGIFNGETAVTVSGGTADINRGVIEGADCGLKVTAGTATVKKLAAIKGGTYSAQRTGGTLKIDCGKFDGALNGNINFTSGYFKTNDNYGISTTGLTEMLVSAGVEYNEGYRYFLGTSESALANGVGVCRIGTTSYAKLEDAIAYANNNPTVQNIVIFMTNNYTLPAGYYTLPANATIVVPMSDEQAKEVNLTAPRIVFNDVRSETPYVSIQPTEFRRLTFAPGVNMDVFGQIELTCSQYASNEAYTSQPVGPYGRLVMEEGSRMVLQDHSELRAWGFMTGKGETDARRGAKVREMFQLGDWKGAMTSVAITGLVTSENPTLCNVVKSQGGVEDCDYSDKKIFPVTQYFIQNIESPVKYHPGAVLSTSAAVSEGLLGMSVSMAATDVAIVGVNGSDQAIFLMDEMADADNTWVRKWYDVENDVQVYDINSAAHIGSMVLDMGDINLLSYGSVPIRLNSAKFDLPLTCNFKIHLLSGTMDFQQNTCLLPGAEVEVDKEATVTVAKDDNDPEHTGALYVYDANEWNKYAYCNEYDGLNLVKGTAYTKVVRYAPSWNGRPDVRAEQTKPADAAINVHGTFMTATGFVYTSASGANIFSSNEDAGTFIFNDDAANAGTRTVNNVRGVQTYESLTFYPARLKHGDGTYENTDEAEKDLAYCYQNDRWSTMIQDGCFMKENRGGNDIFYAKPQEYVALANGKTPNADHTYSDADGAGRLFILMDNCQWWEVENVDNLYHCIHPNNDTYYYWDDDLGEWVEKTYTITWKNWDGTEIKTYDHSGGDIPVEIDYVVTYGTMAEFLGTNPTREATIDYTYDFAGWSPALGPVTSDVTYTATFTQKPRMYTIIFQNEGGVEIERQFLTHNEVPVCENTPTKIGHTLVWEPAIAAVTGDATYTATWLEEPPTEYEVTFFDYDGTTVLLQNNVLVGDMPESPVIMDGKPSGSEGKPGTNEFTYVFDHWSPALEEVSATSIKSYTAVYREVARKYSVRFEDEEGNEIETNEYAYGETPVCSATPTKENTAQYTYSFAWTPQIQTVMDDATYRATFSSTTNKYTVTLRSNIPAACTFTSGAGTYDYGTAITIAKTDNPGYTFVNWTDGETGAEVAELPTSVTNDISLVANFTINDPDYTISWMSEDGSVTLKEVGQKAGTTTTYTGAVPTKPDGGGYTYTFDGWTTEANGAGTFYLNGKTPKATDNTSYFAHFIATPTGDDPEPEPEPESVELDENDAITIVTPTTYENLTITSDGIDLSSEIINAENLTINGHADFVLKKSMERLHWYDVAVPWRVDATSGIFLDGSATPAVLGSDIDLYYYDGAVRAAQGKVDACWIPANVLEPGRAYLFILYKTGATQVTFRKQDGASLLTTATSVQENAQSTGDDKDAGWNGIANPSLFKAYLNAGTLVAQTINAAGDAYVAIDADSYLVVGQPIYVQVSSSNPSVVADHNSYAAPVRRTNASANPARYQLTITAEGANRHADRLFVQLDEEKEADTYVIGKDLSKFGTSTGSAQMWVDRYDAKLCLNTVAPQGDATSFLMSLYAPKAGEYTIAIEREDWTDEYELYLTYDGTAVWNLSQSAYTANLSKGTDARYGLRISAKAPQNYTGIDEAVVNAQGDIRKMLVNDKVFIIRGEKVYTVDGQLVK